jgi:signal transduction histidine kinase/CheY-like chemotaxis protein
MLRKDSLKFISVFILYLSAGYLANYLHSIAGFSSEFWPATGIGLASLVFWGVRFWPAITLAAGIVSFMLGANPYSALIIGIGNTLAVVGVYSLMVRWRIRADLIESRSVRMFLVACGLTPLVSATIGLIALNLGGLVPTNQNFQVWLTWWTGDNLGFVVMYPLIASYFGRKRFPTQAEPAEYVSAALFLVGFCSIAFFDIFGRQIQNAFKPYFFLVLLIWYSLRFFQRGVTLLIFLVSISATFATKFNLGVFAGSPDTNFLQIQIFIYLMSITGLLLAAFVKELQMERDRLEQKVHTRTLELFEKKSLLEEAEHAARLGSWQWDMLNNKLIWSKELFKLFDMEPTRTHVTVDTYYNRLPDFEKERVKNIIFESISKKQNFEIEHALITRQGEVKTILSMGRLLQHNGNVLKYIGTAQDITDKKRIEKELKQAQLDAEAANRAKSAFLANMSHEIRTPLGLVLGFTDLLRESKVDSDEFKKYTESIKRNGTMLLELISDVLDISKIEAGEVNIEKSTFNYLDFLRDIQVLIFPRFQKKNLTLKFSFRGDVYEEIHTDRHRLQQIFINLLGNAVKFTERGYIEVRSHYKKDGHLCIDFADSGIGMDEAQAKKLFAPFTQADASTQRKFGGTGLGLSISRNLACALGGNLQILTTRPGKGSVFRLIINPELSMIHGNHKIHMRELPISFPRALSEKRTLPTLHGKKILVVDDSTDTRFILTKILTANGAQIDETDNGASGLEKALSGEYDVILLDIQMPVLDGIQTLQELRKKGYSKPVIALTAHAMAEEKERCLKLGFNDYITKPINKTILIEHISQAHS